MDAVFLILALVCCALVFMVRREFKVGILLSSLMLFTLIELPVLGNHAHTLVFLCTIISEIKRLPLYIKKLAERNVLIFIIIALLAGIIPIITSPLLHNIHTLVGFCLSEWILKSFSLIYAFCLMKDANSLKFALPPVFFALWIMTAFGLLNVLMGFSIPVEHMYSGSIDGFDFSGSSRFRVQSTFINPFDYGYICLLLLFLCIHSFRLRLINTGMFGINIACCIFGIFSCNCRTVLFCLLAGMCLYLILSVKLTRKTLKNFLLILAGMIVLFVLSPGVQKKMIGVMSIFDADSSVEGSSLGARETQLLAVGYYIKDDILFGRGAYFFSKELGWENGAENASDHDLLGLEGNYLSLLLERGAVGLILFLIEMAVLFAALRKHRKNGRKTYSLGVTALFVYILFGVMTGELSSTPPSFLIIGYVLSALNASNTASRRINVKRVKNNE